MIIEIRQETKRSDFSIEFLASNYALTLSTSKNNYIATLDEVATQNSASPNDGPVPLFGAPTMYPELTQLVREPSQLGRCSKSISFTHYLPFLSSDCTSNAIVKYFEYTQHHHQWYHLAILVATTHWDRSENIIDFLPFRYSNSTVQILMDFLITFSTSCDSQCTNQRSMQLNNQLRNLTNVQVHIQPGNLSDGQVRIRKNGTSVLYRCSLTTQVISNFTGTITLATPPTLITLY